MIGLVGASVLRPVLENFDDGSVGMSLEDVIHVLYLSLLVYL